MKTPNRDELIAAQFMLKPSLYTDWIWQERVRNNPPVPKLRVVIPFKWRESAEIIPLRSRSPLGQGRKI